MNNRWLFLSCLCLAGCISSNGLRYEAASENNVYRLAHIEKGMAQSEVLCIMKGPYSSEVFHVGKDTYDIWFYVTRTTGLGQTRMVPQNLTPLTFKNGILVGTGYNWYYYAMNEEAKQQKGEASPEKKASETQENLELEKALKPDSSLSSKAEPLAGKEPSKPLGFFKPWKPILGAKQIDASKIQTGMTEAEVTRLLGTPSEIEAYRMDSDLYDVWFYQTSSSKKKVTLTFKNGVLVSKTQAFYQKVKQQASSEQIRGYDRQVEQMEEEESDQNFNFW